MIYYIVLRFDPGQILFSMSKCIHIKKIWPDKSETKATTTITMQWLTGLNESGFRFQVSPSSHRGNSLLTSVGKKYELVGLNVI